MKKQALVVKLPDEKREVRLTNREVQCLELMIQGKTAREIAIILLLSRRTVEFYVNNIKLKFGTNCKSELMLKLFASNFLALVDGDAG